MLKPKPDEARETFLHRYMGDVEAIKSQPDEKLRFGVAAQLWENRAALEAANSLGYNSERDGAEPFAARHLQPGVVGYPEMKHPITGKQGIAVLVEKDVIDQMRPSMKGIPILNWQHSRGTRAEAAKWIAEGKAVGVVTCSRWEPADGWEHCDTFVWEKEAKANARNGFRVSNAWTEDEIDWTPGVHNGIPYDGRLIAAHYTHLAIVPTPRYEGAVIYANSKLGGLMKLFGFGKTDGVELDKDAALDIGGKKYPLLEVVNSITAMEAERAKVTTTAKEGVLTDKDEIEVAGKKYSGLEVMNALAIAEKAKLPAAGAAAAPAKEPAAAADEFELPKTREEFHNAVTAALEKVLGDVKGDHFFNAVKEAALKRGAGTGGEAVEHKAGRASERERIKRGLERFGKRAQVKA